MVQILPSYIAPKPCTRIILLRKIMVQCSKAISARTELDLRATGFGEVVVVEGRWVAISLYGGLKRDCVLLSELLPS